MAVVAAVAAETAGSAFLEPGSQFTVAGFSLRGTHLVDSCAPRIVCRSRQSPPFPLLLAVHTPKCGVAIMESLTILVFSMYVPDARLIGIVKSGPRIISLFTRRRFRGQFPQ